MTPDDLDQLCQVMRRHGVTRLTVSDSIIEMGAAPQPIETETVDAPDRASTTRTTTLDDLPTTPDSLRALVLPAKVD